MHPKLERFSERLRRAITQPRHELTRWQALVRFGSDLGRVGTKQLREDKAPQMAAALSFRTLFGLIPTLVVGTVLVKAFGGFDSFRDDLATFLRGMEPMGTASGGDPAAIEQADSIESVTQWILGLLNQVEGSVSLSAIGWIGVCILGYSVISLLVTIEGSFNAIYRAPEGRPWTRRVPVYWTVVTLAPLAIGLPMLATSRVQEILSGLDGSWSWALQIAPVFWSFCVTWLMAFVAYKLLPNTSVQMRPALIGAFVAAILLEIGRRTLGEYVEHALQFINGALGLIPIFMFWVYLMWLVVLFGLEVSAILQRLAGRSLDEFKAKKRTGFVDPASILVVMEVAAARFERGQPSAVPDLADAANLPEALVNDMVTRLEEAGLLLRVRGHDAVTVTLARPPASIETAKLLDIGYGLVDELQPGPASSLLERLRGGQRKAVGTGTLASLTALAESGK